MTKRNASRAARDLLGLLGIEDLAGRSAAELAGGQQQRAGLARALAREARLYLFDEPTAHLDALVRVTVQEEIARRRAETGAAAVYATHDSAEALAVADRVAIIRAGSVVQLDSPEAIYERPVDVWAARLTGPASIFEVQSVRGSGGRLEVAVGSSRVLAETAVSTAKGTVSLLVRPESVAMDGSLSGVVRELWFRGPHTDYRLETTAGWLHARLPGPPRLATGESSGWAIERGWVPRPVSDGGETRVSFSVAGFRVSDHRERLEGFRGRRIREGESQCEGCLSVNRGLPEGPAGIRQPRGLGAHCRAHPGRGHHRLGGGRGER